jgi:hypothetical protein
MYYAHGTKLNNIRKPKRNKARNFSDLTGYPTGPVTDYSSSVLHWMRDRAPNYRGGYTGERERPSASYIVDVRATRKLPMMSIENETNAAEDDSTSRTTSVPS